MGRGRLLVAIAVGVVLVMGVAGGAAYLVLGAGGGSPSAAAPSPTLPTDVPRDATTQDFYNLAVAASEATLASFTPPPSTTRIDGPPTGWIAFVPHPESDETLTRTSWWETSLSEAEVTDYLSQGAPSRVTTKETADGSGAGTRAGYSTAMFEEPVNPVYMAYSAPVLSLAYQTIGGTTYIKVSSFVTARYAVPKEYRITEPIVSVRIEQTTTVVKNGRTKRVKKSPTVTYSEQGGKIARLVMAYNLMPADFTVPMTYHCPAEPATTTATTVTFTGYSGHVWTATTAPYACGLGFQLSSGDQTYEHVLDGTQLFKALRRAHA